MHNRKQCDQNGAAPAVKSRPTVTERLNADELTETEARELTREAALRTLDRTAKSRAELAASLARRGYPEFAITPILDRFTAVGLLDDSGYAAALVSSRTKERGLAKPLIAAELARRGIAPEIIETAMSQVDAAAEQTTITRLVQSNLRRTLGLARQVRVRRAVGALQRKGYEPHQAYTAVLNAIGAESDGTDGAEQYDVA